MVGRRTHKKVPSSEGGRSRSCHGQHAAARRWRYRNGAKPQQRRRRERERGLFITEEERDSFSHLFCPRWARQKCTGLKRGSTLIRNGVQDDQMCFLFIHSLTTVFLNQQPKSPPHPTAFSVSLIPFSILMVGAYTNIVTKLILNTPEPEVSGHILHTLLPYITTKISRILDKYIIVPLHHSKT